MSIDILINGDPEQINEDITVFELLHFLEIDPTTAAGLAVAVNDEVVRKSDWSDMELKAGDSVEIVTAQQGG